jgi:hypothetical protein
VFLRCISQGQSRTAPSAVCEEEFNESLGRNVFGQRAGRRSLNLTRGPVWVVSSMLSSPCRVFTRSWFSQRRTWSQSASNNARYVPVLLTGAAVSAVAVYFYWPRPSRSAPTYHKVPLSPSHFTPVTLSSCETTSRDTKLFTLTVLLHLIPDEASLTPIWSVFIKDDDIQVERPYTPLEGIDSQGRMTFWIKKYPNGEVGRWLHSKDVGDTIEIRGPLRTWEWQHDVWDEVIMVRAIREFFFVCSANLNERGRYREGQELPPCTSCCTI